MQKTIDGIRLAYDDAGSGNILVLLHGFPFDRAIWDQCFMPLARHARVIRIDLRGAGESGLGVGPALMETLAGDVFGLLDALDVEHAMVAGHSMGGYVALAYFRMYAERVTGLGLVASHVGADTAERAAARDLQAALVESRGTEPLVESIVPSAFEPAFAAAHPATVDGLRAMIARQNPAGLSAQIIGMKERLDSSDLLDDIRVPSLIVAGESDPLIAAPILARTAAALADCEYTGLSEVRHLPMLEAPEATTAALLRLVARCAATSKDPQSARATHV